MMDLIIFHKGIMVFIQYKMYFLSPYTNPTPKPTPYRKLSTISDFQNTSFCMIYKLFSSWGPKNVPTRSKCTGITIRGDPE